MLYSQIYFAMFNASFCNTCLVYVYICTMKNEITIPDHFPAPKEEDLKAAEKRRENYSIARDQQAREDNEAIVRRLIRDKENQK